MPNDDRTLAEVIGDMENLVRAADERAIAVLKIVRAGRLDGGLSEAEMRGLERVADDVTTATLNLIAEWEHAFDLAHGKGEASVTPSATPALN